MHGLFVGGVWNIVLYLFLEMFIDAGVRDIYTLFSNFIAGWSWPGRINGAHLHEIFEENRKDKHRAAKKDQSPGIIYAIHSWCDKDVHSQCGAAVRLPIQATL